MNLTMRMAAEEWRYMARNRLTVAGLLILALLTLVASLTVFEHQRKTSAERARYQAQANDAFAAQPDRHPHRVAHAGHFVFRPVSALAAFDPGIDAYTGQTVFLEAHRQNGVSFGDVSQSSLLLRFGQLTPAFVLQVLAPLLLIFVGHAAVAREQQHGTLRVLLAQGVSSRQIILGKLLALCSIAALALLPTVLALGWLAYFQQASWLLAAWLVLGYGIWLLIWSITVVLVSAVVARGRDALLSLLALWVVLAILLPRGVADVANAVVALPSKFETDIAVVRDYLALGDAHNPDDPHFSAFRQQLLTKYGVAKVEDLPVNYKGLLSMEGERASSELFNRYAAKTFNQQQAQLTLVDRFAWLSPTLALRRLSMAASGTDLLNFHSFLEQAEHYRYNLVQRLNQLQAQTLSYKDDTNPNKENRIEHSHWQQFPTFEYQAESVSTGLQRSLPSLGVLSAWLLILVTAVGAASKRLGSGVK
ncbi:ABC transporter permease [Pseudomonas putida]|uniref:ABC transporter permease n=1 Tax=Pseudomonas putida TaxID=303 RepID=UPI002365D887|nr:DUF3526 domain-containing protein [Pseudomonas putida]MDD2047796.1 DUF3526 domain-containing protein [Pseudomonas putida]